jgi:hypothetical protein
MRWGCSTLPRVAFAIAVLAVGFAATFVAACPFCSALKPTLAQQCDSAAVAFLGECIGINKGDARAYEFNVRKPLKLNGQATTRQLAKLPTASQMKVGSLAIVIGDVDSAAQSNSANFDWQAKPLNEVSFAYVARLPNLRTATLERLKYFAAFLEHADPLVAEDAFSEFGHAPYDQVAQAAALLPASKLRAWIIDPKVLPERKGFYGLALGLTARGDELASNVRVLEKLISTESTPGADFRAGFDGIIAGYLLATGADGIDQIKRRFVDSATVAEGDLRHVQSALRFYHEFGPTDERAAVVTLVEQMLARPSLAAAAVTDLARWQAWPALERVAKLYPDASHAEVNLQKAIVGYLLACPLPTASAVLDELRLRDPHGIAAAEQALQLLGGAP